MAEKKKLTGLFRHNPETPEGKYLVTRRDGSVPEWPSFVLGGRDPVAPWALRVYAVVAFLYFWNWRWSLSVWRWAASFRAYRREYGAGDPDRGPHRPDDPATVAKMRRGLSA